MKKPKPKQRAGPGGVEALRLLSTENAGCLDRRENVKNNPLKRKHVQGCNNPTWKKKTFKAAPAGRVKGAKH